MRAFLSLPQGSLRTMGVKGPHWLKFFDLGQALKETAISLGQMNLKTLHQNHLEAELQIYPAIDFSYFSFSTQFLKPILFL